MRTGRERTCTDRNTYYNLLKLVHLRIAMHSRAQMSGGMRVCVRDRGTHQERPYC